jgi:small nuclear ribonucleoprotein (snRNP)-like protein
MLWLRLRPPFVLRSVIVNLKSDETLQGVLWSTRGAWFTLQKAAILSNGQPPTPIDGEVVIHRDNISFVQVLP